MNPMNISLKFINKKNLLLFLLIGICISTNIIFQNVLPSKGKNTSSQSPTLNEIKDDQALAEHLQNQPHKMVAMTLLSVLVLTCLVLSVGFNVHDFFIFLRRKKIKHIKSQIFAKALPYSSAFSLCAIVYFWYTTSKVVQLYCLILLRNNSLVSMLFTTAFMQIACIVSILFLAKARFFRFAKKFIKQIPILLKIYISMLPFIFVAGIISAKIGSIANFPITPMPLVEIMMSRDIPLFALIILSLEAVILAPISEELIFRGVLFSTLRNNFSFAFSSIVSALIFSVLHEHYLSFLPIVVLAIIFSKVYEKTGNLIYPIFLHALYNGISLTMMFTIKYIIN